MYLSTTEISVPEAMSVAVTEDTLTTELSDGRDDFSPFVLVPAPGACDTGREKQLGTDWRWPRHSLA